VLNKSLRSTGSLRFRVRMRSGWGERRRVMTKHNFVEESLVARGGSSALIWGMARRSSAPYRRQLAVALIGLAIFSSACSSATDDRDEASTTTGRSGSTVAASTPSTTPTTAMGSSTTTTATSSTTTVVAGASNAELTAAVRAFWDLYLSIGSNAGPFDGEATRARLAERTTGASLNRLLAYFSSNAASGYVVRGAVEIAPTVVSINGDTAQVRDCYDDTTGLYRISDGSRVDTDNPLRHQVLMTFVREGGVWKVSAISDEGDGCAAPR